VNNADTCTDDDDECTDDVCAGGLCTHPATGLCECDLDDDCDDENPCTDDTCSGSKACEYENNTDPCTDDSNVCTDDVCGGGSCQHTSNTDPCADDGTDCTDDVCGGGSCQHTSNMTCECVQPSDCDALETDPMNCTFNRCTPGGDCDFVDNDSCDAGTEFTVNSFNNSAHWLANQTTPDQRPLVATGANTNLEGNANLFFADSDGASLVMDVASMAGLDRLAFTIQSSSMNTASMVTIGVYDGSQWHDLPLLTYGQISQNIYGVIEIPLLDFDVPLGTITKVRFVTNPTGGERIWRIDHIQAKP
jgi:hypothetical protein